MDLRSARKDPENSSEHLSLSLTRPQCGDGDKRFRSRDTSEEEWDRREDDDDEGVMEEEDEEEEDTTQEEMITGSSTLNSKYVSWSKTKTGEIVLVQ